MKKIYVIVISFLFFTQLSYCQIISAELGYNSGFSGIVGIGVNDIDYGDSDLLAQYNGSFSSTIGYKFLLTENEYYQGPNLQLSYGVLFGESPFGIKGGLNSSLLFNSGDSKINLEPFIGINMAAYNLKFYYNVSDIDDFFPRNYNRWGISLSIELPLKDDNWNLSND